MNNGAFIHASPEERDAAKLRVRDWLDFFERTRVEELDRKLQALEQERKDKLATYEAFYARQDELAASIWADWSK